MRAHEGHPPAHPPAQCSVRLLTRPLTAQPKPRAGIHASPACLRLVDSPTNQPKSEPITPCHSRQLRRPPPPYLRLRPTCDLQHPPALPCLSYPPPKGKGSSSPSFVPPRFTCPLLRASARLDAASTTSSSSDSIASGSGTYGLALHWTTLLAICSPPCSPLLVTAFRSLSHPFCVSLCPNLP